ncbi:MAG: prolipoprotein diacylglyceryl transferase [Clostridia bacterium]|nr:prolipoprotein diacylglyceryl transferase [Clostridia bacterium]
MTKAAGLSAPFANFIRLSKILGTPDRVAFSVFGLDIMWYGLLIGIGMVLAVVLCYNRAPKHGLNQEHILDLAIYCIPAGVIGARLYYVIFQWNDYKDNLKSILNIREGGLAIHGGVLAGVGLGVILLVKVWKEKPLDWVDLCVPTIALAQGIGRWGNYFNQEAYGVETTVPWAIEVGGRLVHPTFLYESLWCLALGLFLMWLEDSGNKKFRGQILCLYLILYSAERFLVEGLRTDSLMIGPLRQAQVLSLCLIAAGCVLWVILSRRKTQAVAKPGDPSEEAGQPEDGQE